MVMKIILYVGIVFNLLISATAQQSCREGQISGKVLDITGKPVENAEVRTLPELCAMVGVAPFAVTDSEGRFHLHGVLEGPNSVFAKKEEAGYPDTRFVVFATDESVPRVVVKAGEEVSGIIVTLGKKARRFSGNVLDAETSQPLGSARIILRRMDKPQLLYSTSVGPLGEFTLLVPSNLHVTVSAAGYRSWEFVNSQTPQNSNITGEAEKPIEVTVRLKKVETAQ
jgi:hypothetical protein